jgi:polyisoprenoid-binding protein YceI
VPLAVLVLCAVVVACTPGLAPAAESAAATERWPVTLGTGSTLWIDGTSTLHDWSSRTDSTLLEFRVASGTAKPADAHGIESQVRAQAVHGVAVDVPVHSLRSKDGKLDKNLWKAMRTDEFPIIHFELSSYAPGPARAGNDTLAIHATGTLTICGKARPIELDAVAHAGDGGLWLVGSEELLMSEYGIKPPKMMMGTIKVGDRIQVHYRLLLVPGTAGVPATPAGSDERGAHK